MLRINSHRIQIRIQALGEYGSRIPMQVLYEQKLKKYILKIKSLYETLHYIYTRVFYDNLRVKR